MKKDLKKAECIIQVHHSNLDNKIQDEIQFAYFGHQNFRIFTACSYLHPSGMADTEKVLITISNETNDQLRIASFAYISKVIDRIEKRISLLSSLQHIYVWSDGSFAQFRSRFTFVLLIHLHPDKNIE